MERSHIRWPIIPVVQLINKQNINIYIISQSRRGLAVQITRHFSDKHPWFTIFDASHVYWLKSCSCWQVLVSCQNDAIHKIRAYRNTDLTCKNYRFFNQKRAASYLNTILKTVCSSTTHFFLRCFIQHYVKYAGCGRISTTMGQFITISYFLSRYVSNQGHHRSINGHSGCR